MNVKRESIHTKEKNRLAVDLSKEGCQKKMVDYLQYGVASSDNKGHSIHLQTKVTPVQGDILEGVRSKAPENYFKTQSQVLRSVISLGCYVALKIFENIDDIPNLKEEFQLQLLLNRVNKKKRINELFSESRRAPLDLKVEGNFDELSKMLRKVLEESDEDG